MKIVEFPSAQHISNEIEKQFLPEDTRLFDTTRLSSRRFHTVARTRRFQDRVLEVCSPKSTPKLSRSVLLDQNQLLLSDPPSTVCLRNAVVLPDGVLLTEKGSYITELHLLPAHRQLSPSFFNIKSNVVEGEVFTVAESRSNVPVHKLPGLVIFSCVRNFANYFHFLVDFVSSLWLPELRSLFHVTYFLLPRSLTRPFHLEILQKIGVSPERFIMIDSYFGMNCDLVVAGSPHGGYSRHCNPKKVDTILNLLNFRRRELPKGKPKVVFSLRISSFASGRGLKNSDEFIDSLARKLFSVEIISVDFAKIDVSTQMLLCSEASVLVGIHGAGLTNLIFMPQLAGLVELSIREFGGAYSDLAFAAGLAYAVVEPTREEYSSMNVQDTWADLMEFDVDDVADAISFILDK